eukprot:gene16049-21789_t
MDQSYVPLNSFDIMDKSYLMNSIFISNNKVVNVSNVNNMNQAEHYKRRCKVSDNFNFMIENLNINDGSLPPMCRWCKHDFDERIKYMTKLERKKINSYESFIETKQSMLNSKTNGDSTNHIDFIDLIQIQANLKVVKGTLTKRINEQNLLNHEIICEINNQQDLNEKLLPINSYLETESNYLDLKIQNQLEHLQSITSELNYLKQHQNYFINISHAVNNTKISNNDNDCNIILNKFSPLFDSIVVEDNKIAHINGQRLSFQAIPDQNLNWAEINTSWSIVSTLLLCIRNKEKLSNLVDMKKFLNVTIRNMFLSQFQFSNSRHKLLDKTLNEQIFISLRPLKGRSLLVLLKRMAINGNNHENENDPDEVILHLEGGVDDKLNDPYKCNYNRAVVGFSVIVCVTVLEILHKNDHLNSMPSNNKYMVGQTTTEMSKLIKKHCHGVLEIICFGLICGAEIGYESNKYWEVKSKENLINGTVESIHSQNSTLLRDKLFIKPLFDYTSTSNEINSLLMDTISTIKELSLS